MARKAKKAEADKLIRLKVNPQLYENARQKLEERGTTIETFVRLQLHAFGRQVDVIHLTDKMPFGKYQGALVEDIVRTDTRYVQWLISSSSNPAKYGVDVMQLVEKLSQDEEIPFD